MKTIEKYLYAISFWILDKYYWLKNYIFRGEYSKKHFIFQKEGNQYRLIIKSHEEFSAEMQRRIDSFKQKNSERKYIYYALEQVVDGGNYIIFSKGKDFVQFWINRGKIDFDFPIIKANGNKKYYYQVIGLLADMDFVRNTFVQTGTPTFSKIPKNYVYEVNVFKNITEIKGHFVKMTEQATSFTVRMFKEIYKTKKGKLKIEVG